MGAVKKSTKKFVKSKLKGVIQQRRKHQANLRKSGKNAANGVRRQQQDKTRNAKKHPNDSGSDVGSDDDDDDDTEQQFGFSKADLISALKASKTSKQSKNKDAALLAAAGSDSEPDFGNSDGSEEDDSDDDSADDSDSQGGAMRSVPGDDDDDSNASSDDDRSSVDLDEVDIESDDEADPNGKLNVQKQINKDITSHKMELETLKERDPEFYEYLKKNDQELLMFKDEEEISEVEDDEDAMELDQDGMQLGDDEDEEEEEIDNSIVLTMELLKLWRNRVAETHSINTLKKMLIAYKGATVMDDSEENEDVVIQYKIENDKVFRALIFAVIQLTPITLDFYLGRIDADGNRKSSLPSTCNKWRKVSPLAKSYLNSTLKLLSTMTDLDTIRSILQSTSHDGICPYFASFPKLGKDYLKLLVKFWTSSEEEIRIVAFLSMRRMASVSPKPYLEMALKACTNACADQSRAYSAQTAVTIHFMHDCIAELGALDGEILYQYAFVNIRKLAVALRTAINKRSVETLKQVYNWQFVQTLFLWTKVVGNYCNPDVHMHADIGKLLRPLIYPLTQVTIGVLRLKPSSKFLPLKFQCVRILIKLAGSTKVYIPTASYLLEVFDSADLKTKGKPSTLKPMDFTHAIKVNNTHLGTRVLNEGIIKETFKLLGDFYATQENSFAYPELALPCIIQLKKFSKKLQSMKNVAGNKQANALVEKLRLKSQEIEKRRLGATF